MEYFVSMARRALEKFSEKWFCARQSNESRREVDQVQNSQGSNIQPIRIKLKQLHYLIYLPINEHRLSVLTPILALIFPHTPPQ